MSVTFDKIKRRWRFEFKKTINGQLIRTTKLLPKGCDRDQAITFDKEETNRLHAIATGTEEQKVLIEDAVALYYKHRLPELKTEMETKKELALLYPYFAGKTLDQLHDVALDYRKKASEAGLAPATIKVRLSYLRAACNYSFKAFKLGKGLVSIPMPKVNNERQVYAYRKNLLKISRKTSCKYCRALIWLAFYTGQRLSTLIAIGNTTKVIDGKLHIPDTKNGTPHIVPIHPRAMAALKFFPLPYKTSRMQKWIREAMDAAGFQHLRFHDLRHSCASALVNNGVDLFTVGKVLNHKDLRSTQRYSHLNTKTIGLAILKIK